MTATLRMTAAAELGPRGRRLVIDCRHGTTYLDQFVPDDAPVVIDKVTMIRVAVARHEAEEGCGCARGLDTLRRKRSGLARA